MAAAAGRASDPSDSEATVTVSLPRVPEDDALALLQVICLQMRLRCACDTRLGSVLAGSGAALAAAAGRVGLRESARGAPSLSLVRKALMGVFTDGDVGCNLTQETAFKLNVATRLFRHAGDTTPVAVRCARLYEEYCNASLEDLLGAMADEVEVADALADAVRLFDDKFIPVYHITTAAEDKPLPADAGTASYGPIQHKVPSCQRAHATLRLDTALQAWETLIGCCADVIAKGAAAQVVLAAVAELLTPKQGLWRMQGSGGKAAAAQLQRRLVECLRNA